MEQTTGTPVLHLVASTAEPRNPKLAAEAAGKLAECRTLLVGCEQFETVRLLDIVLLQLHTELQGVSHGELAALSAALAATQDNDCR